jgi:hypothetical protein
MHPSLHSADAVSFPNPVLQLTGFFLDASVCFLQDPAVLQQQLDECSAASAAKDGAIQDLTNQVEIPRGLVCLWPSSARPLPQNSPCTLCRPSTLARGRPKSARLMHVSLIHVSCFQVADLTDASAAKDAAIADLQQQVADLQAQVAEAAAAAQQTAANLADAAAANNQLSAQVWLAPKIRYKAYFLLTARNPWLDQPMPEV